MSYIFRDLQAADLCRVVEIYNSQPQFLLHHLGRTAVDADFIAAEAAEMERVGFRSAVICTAGGDVIGTLDHRAGEEAYLSLLLLAAEVQGQGHGRAVYGQLEAELKAAGCRRIRIDVVDDYPENVLAFWQKLGFVAAERICLCWGGKTSAAQVLRKELSAIDKAAER